MSDIRKRTGSRGVTYQVRYPSKKTKSGYAYASFPTKKDAQAFLESGKIPTAARSGHTGINSIEKATDLWLEACKSEGLNGRDPVSQYTYENYEYRAGFIKSYEWPCVLGELTAPHVVAFRSWLLGGEASRELASKVMSTLHSILKEMMIRGHIPHNPATGICVRMESRYQEPVTIPTKQDIVELLRAADALANSKNKQIARTWVRYRPMIYLAVDSGMRPQEYLALSRSAIRETGAYIDRAISGCGREISVTKTPAGRRFIGLSAETLDMVQHYIKHHSGHNDHDLIFPTAAGGWQSRRNWQRRGFNVACEKAGLIEAVDQDGTVIERVKYRPYDLRHFFASMLIEKETNLKKIQVLMGHTNIETTLNVYGHLLEDQETDTSEPKGMLSDLPRNSCGESVANAT